LAIKPKINNRYYSKAQLKYCKQVSNMVYSESFSASIAAKKIVVLPSPLIIIMYNKL